MSETPSSSETRPSSAVVLAAGEGIRLRPLTANRPKPMLPAGTRPILEHVLNALIDAGVDDIHLVVGYQANRVRSYFGSTYRDVSITYHTQANQLGSGHALLQARDGPEDRFCWSTVTRSSTIESSRQSVAHTPMLQHSRSSKGQKQSITVQSISRETRSQN